MNPRGYRVFDRIQGTPGQRLVMLLGISETRQAPFNLRASGAPGSPHDVPASPLAVRK